MAKLNEYQRVAERAYLACADDRLDAVVQNDMQGDTLLQYVMLDLSDVETLDEAVERMRFGRYRTGARGPRRLTRARRHRANTPAARQRRGGGTSNWAQMKGKGAVRPDGSPFVAPERGNHDERRIRHS
jgi:hypothetical protein